MVSHHIAVADGSTALDARPRPDAAAVQQRADLVLRVSRLLADRSWLDPQQLADELGTSTAEVMFAVRELESAGLVKVEAAPVSEVGEIDPEPTTPVESGGAQA